MLPTAEGHTDRKSLGSFQFGFWCLCWASPRCSSPEDQANPHLHSYTAAVTVSATVDRQHKNAEFAALLPGPPTTRHCHSLSEGNFMSFLAAPGPVNRWWSC